MILEKEEQKMYINFNIFHNSGFLEQISKG